MPSLSVDYTADDIINAMRHDEWFAFDMFDAISGQAKLATAAVEFAKKAQANGCAIPDVDDLATRLRLIADIFSPPKGET